MNSRASILERIEQVMGTAPSDERPDLDMQVVETRSRDGASFQKIRFTPQQGDRAWAWLGLPDGISGPTPAVMCLHQTTRPKSIGKDEPAGFGGDAGLHYAAELTARGFITLSPDDPTFGEYDIDCYAMGFASVMRKGVFNDMRAIDLLKSLPQVDGDRIGCIGHSRGGHGTLFLAAFDPRVRVAVSSCGFTRFVDDTTFHFWSRPVNLPRVATMFGNDPARLPFDFPDVLRAIAPRPLFVNAPTRDVMTLSGVLASLSEVEPLYAPDALVAAHPDCEHAFPADVRQQAYAFIERALNEVEL
jgi:dienelactone hydrolase